MSETEEWRTVPGYEGYYEVSTHGQVRSLDRTINQVIQGRVIPSRRKGRVLKQVREPRGHLWVHLHANDVADRRYVHVLILETFVGPRPQGMHGCHNNGNPADNRLENLRWDSPTGNRLDSVKHGTHNFARRSHCPRGHLLAPPNLVQSFLRKGARKCVACNRAAAALYKHSATIDPAELQAVSDDRYRKLLAEAKAVKP